METRRIIFTRITDDDVMYDYELAYDANMDIRDVRYHLDRLIKGDLIEMVDKIKLGRRVRRGYQSKQKSLLN